jgi:regulator of replication initiation timing
MTKRRPSPEHANTLSLKALRGLVTGLVDRVEVLSAEVKELREKNAVLCEENEILRLASKICRLDHRFARPAWTRQRTPCPPTDRGRRNPADQSSM